MKRILILVLFLLACLASTSRAGSLHWKCSYSLVASLDGLQKEQFQLEFALDTSTRRAVLIGNAGLADVDFYNGDQGVTFQERLPTGAIQTTTITHKDGSSVHSRHSIVLGQLAPTQYYGKCN